MSDTFLMTDQPETCPKCGARTHIREDNDDVEQDDGTVEHHQLHECMNHNCRYRYWLVLDTGERDVDGKRCRYCDAYRDSPADVAECHHCGNRQPPV